MCGEPDDDQARGGVRFTDTKQIAQFRCGFVPLWPPFPCVSEMLFLHRIL